MYIHTLRVRLFCGTPTIARMLCCEGARGLQAQNHKQIP